jgi:hypothetical protein
MVLPASTPNLLTAIAMTLAPWRRSYVEEVFALPSPFIENTRIRSITHPNSNFLDVDHQLVCVHLH